MDWAENHLAAYLFRGEGENLEFKQRLNDEYKIAKTLCAFANTTGGVILIGIKDDKTIVGVDPEEERHILEKAAGFLCNPPVNMRLEEIYLNGHHGEERVALKASIAESDEKPHFALSRSGEWIPYLRFRDKTLLAGPKAVNSMKTAGIKKAAGLSPNESRLLDYLKEYERITLKKYMALVNISERRARRELHEALEKGLIRILQHEKQEYFVSSRL